MKINENTHYFEHLTDEEASTLIVLAEKLHMRETVSLEHPMIKPWLDIVLPSESLIAKQIVCKEYLPVRMALSAARHFRDRTLTEITSNAKIHPWRSGGTNADEFLGRKSCQRTSQ